MLKYFFLPLIVAAYLWLFPPLIPSPVPPVPPTITITATQAANPEQTAIANRAAAFTAQFFREQYGVELTEPVQIILVPDILCYVRTLEPLVGHELAWYQATHSAGTTANNRIIINTGASQTYEDSLFVTAHELAHQYQLQTMGADITRFNWLIEGMADIVAANVVAANFSGSSGKTVAYRKSWQRMLLLANQRPRLADLDKRDAWRLAASQHGAAAYRTADLAVFALVDRAGYKSLQTFLSDNSNNREQAFQTAFGIPLNDFIAEFEQTTIGSTASTVSPEPSP